MEEQNFKEKENTDHKNEILFLITISYFIAFLFIRIAVILAGSAGSAVSSAVKAGELSFYIGANVVLFGYHIHHFYFGIILIFIAGGLAIIGSDYFSRKQLAIIYGIGLGLFMDEIGLLLSWGNYWSRVSYILTLFLGGIFINLVLFPYFWKEVRKNLAASTSPPTQPQHMFAENKILKWLDQIVKEISKTEKIRLTFMGLLYIAFGIVILIYPRLVYYWVAMIFILQGLSSLVQAWNL